MVVSTMSMEGLVDRQLRFLAAQSCMVIVFELLTALSTIACSLSNLADGPIETSCLNLFVSLHGILYLYGVSHVCEMHAV